MKSTQLLFFLTFFSLITFGQNNPTTANQSSVQALMNKRMPNFSAKDIMGQTYNSKKFKNKVVFINFWFLDCPPCIQELKQLSDLYHTVYTNPEVIFLSITFDKLKDIQSFISTSDTLERGGKTRAHFKRFFKFDNAIQYPIISSPDKKIEKQYRLDGWPTSFIIDKKGIIRLINVGLKLDEPENYLFEKYSKKINDLLAE